MDLSTPQDLAYPQSHKTLNENANYGRELPRFNINEAEIE
jgi:hypothetical protein